MSEPLINGVPASQYGVWCKHGKRLLVPDPADASDYPACVRADPWPCDESDCTYEQLEAEMEAEAAAYEQERMDEYWADVRSSLTWDAVRNGPVPGEDTS